ncbi:hypothetical protein K1W54_29195, partial [Micromonospora sp. CPCC 205371]|nr:hypothetical protein [Micromonospora sp. CPCC 205371]
RRPRGGAGRRAAGARRPAAIKGIRIEQGRMHAKKRSNHAHLPLIGDGARTFTLDRRQGACVALIGDGRVRSPLIDAKGAARSDLIGGKGRAT